MTREHFVQVLNLSGGYSVQHRMIEDARSSWTDQKNWLDHMHNLEKKMFEKSVEFFFDNRYGGYVLDDELISSKASEIEHKVVSDRKSGGEGPTCAFGPILACNHGYGKKTTVEMFVKWNFKVVAIANSIGSEHHPIVGTSAVKEYIQKIHQNQALQLNSAVDSDSDSNDGILDPDISSFRDSIGSFLSVT